MKKNIISELEDTNTFNSIPGFTYKFLKEVENVITKGKVSVENVINTPTYEFVALALQNDSPLQVIKTMKVLKKKYAFKMSVDKEVLGFFNCIEGKAYGYVALNIKNIEWKYKFYKLAEKAFNAAKARGYKNAILDYADLKQKFCSDEAAELYTLNNLYLTNEGLTKLGEIYTSFTELTNNALRVLENKRPIIEDESNFRYSYGKYLRGSEHSVSSKIYYGLALIIEREEGGKEKGLKMIKENIEEFKKYHQNIDKILFASDAKEFKNNLSILENKIIKNNIR